MTAQLQLRRTSRLALLASSAALALSALAAPAVAHSQPAALPDSGSLHVGTMALHPCRLGHRTAYCGALKVPLDYTHPTNATIAIHFGWLPAAHPTTPRPRTVVAQEGGPGYPSIGTAADYIKMLGHLLDTENMLVMDERGTGTSALIDCLPLQTLGNLTSTPAFHRAVAACADQLDHTYPKAGGGYVHAGDLFSTANGARDLNALLAALQTGPVDLYGDSYGTYFAQSFMSHFPSMLRSVTLDAAYEARDLDPWYVSTVTTAHQSFNRVCHLAAACEQAAPGSSWARISELADSVRNHPVSGTTTGVSGKPVHVVVDETALVNIVNDAGYDFDPYRQLDAAARAYLDDLDSQPLLRLWAQDIGWDDSDYSAPASYYSDGQFMAVACTDYPQLFDMSSSQSARKQQLAAAIRHQSPTTFAPFTIREWLSMQPYTETYTGCLNWPSPVHRADPPVLPGPMDPGHVPVLILNGSIDSLTPAVGGAHVARQIGKDARAVVVPNMVHLVGLVDRFGCGASLVQRFIARPGQLHTMDTSCTKTVPEVHAVGRYPQLVAAALPASGAAPLRVRRLASVVTAAAGDAAVRYNYVDGLHDSGLRGGKIGYSVLLRQTFKAELRGVRWTTDSEVNGSVTFSPYGLTGRAKLAITSSGRTSAATVSWDTDKPDAVAVVHIDGYRLTLPAP